MTAMVSRYAHVIAPVRSDLADRLADLLWSSSPRQLALTELPDSETHGSHQPGASNRDGGGTTAFS